MYDLLFLRAVQITEGYSGSDLRLVCKEAAMRPVRKIFDILESTSSGEHFYPLPIVSPPPPPHPPKKEEKKLQSDFQHQYLSILSINLNML